MEVKKTPLYHSFIKRGANMRNAGGYFAPIAFSDPKTEHLTTRDKAGLFEIFGQFLVEVAGTDAERLINETHVADVTKLPDMKGTYCGILNDQGNFLDDVITWRVDVGKFWVCPAPHRVDVIVNHLKKAGEGMAVNVVCLGYRYTSLSIQGPKSRACLQALVEADLSNEALKPFEILETSMEGVNDVIISRTGFTGELGYELFIPTQNVEDLYQALLDTGAENGLVPCGVAAMVSLRIEKRYPIFGRDITEENNPVEAGLGWTIRDKEAEYPGKAKIEALKSSGTEQRLVLIEIPEGIAAPEAGTELSFEGRTVGRVTSAGMGHSIGRALAMGYVTSALAADGQVINVGEAQSAKIHIGAIYDPKNTRSRV